MPAIATMRQCLMDSHFGQALSSQHLEVLLQHVQHQQVLRGSTVFAEGDSADSLSVVCSGRIALEMHVPTSGSIRILTLGPRDVLGWSALVGDGHMSASAVALVDTDLLQFPAEILKVLCEDDTQLGRHIMTQVAQILANRLRQTRLQLLDLFSQMEPADD